MVKDDSQLKWEIFGIKCCSFHMDGHNTTTCKLPIIARSDSTPLNQSTLVDYTPYSYKALAPPNQVTPVDFTPSS